VCFFLFFLFLFQGYRFDKNETKGFKISYGKEPHEHAKDKFRR